MRPLLLLVFFSLGSFRALAGESWGLEASEGCLWLSDRDCGRDLFDLRLGGGGSIDEIIHGPGGQALMASPYGGNDTDRVFQWTLWSDSYSAEAAGIIEPFNEDLAGSEDGTFSPVVSVAHAGSAVDVYAVPQDQWDRSLNAQMRARYSCLTRYEPMPGGEIRVRRVVLVGTAAGTQDSDGRYDIYFEEWTPLRVGDDAFDSLALELDGAGSPVWWYRAGVDIPYYPGLPAQSTFGYALAYRGGALRTAPVIAIVFGTKPLAIKSDAVATGQPVFNSMDWELSDGTDQGLAMLPALLMQNVAPGSVIDATYYLVLRPSGGEAVAAQLRRLAAATPPPVLYGPGSVYSGDLAEIVRNLRRNADEAGVRTNQLAALIGRRAGIGR